MGLDYFTENVGEVDSGTLIRVVSILIAVCVFVAGQFAIMHRNRVSRLEEKLEVLYLHVVDLRFFLKPPKTLGRDDEKTLDRNLFYTRADETLEKLHVISCLVVLHFPKLERETINLIGDCTKYAQNIYSRANEMAYRKKSYYSYSELGKISGVADESIDNLLELIQNKRFTLTKRYMRLRSKGRCILVNLPTAEIT